MPGAHEAITLTELGFAVFPLEPRGKRPVTRNGFKDATQDHDTITHWWADWPNANIGVATGPTSGILVVDIDGPAAETAWRNLANPEDDDTLEVRTGRGRHLYYQCTDPLPNTASRIAPGIDTRGHGGYVVAPPSIHPDGATYEWTAARRPRPLPDWIRQAVTPPAATNGAGDPAQVLNHPATHAYAAATLHNLFGAVASAPEGQRNDALNKAAFAAGRLIAGGVLNEHDAEITLHAAASAAGLTTTETHATLHSGVTAGQQHPWTPDLRAPTAPQAIPPRAGDQEGAPPPADEDELLTTAGFRPLNIQELITTPPPDPDWLIPGLLERGEVAWLAGRGKAGKSMVALLLSGALLHGHTFLGIPLQTGRRVVYLDCENREKTVHRRLHLLGPELFATNFQYHLLRGSDLGTQEGLNALRHVARDTDLIILDSIIGLHRIDENDAMEVRRYVSGLRAISEDTGTTILGLLHENRAGDPRGSLDWRNAADTVIQLERNETDGTRTLKVLDKRDGPDDQGDITFTFTQGTAPDGTTRLLIQGGHTHHLAREMGRVSDVLEQDGGALTKNEIDRRAKGGRTAIFQAVECLIETGHVVVEYERDGQAYRLAKPYLEG